MSDARHLFPMIGLFILIGVIVGLFGSFFQGSEFFHGTYPQIRKIVMWTGLAFLMLAVFLNSKGSLWAARIWFRSLSFLLGVILGGMIY